MKHLHRCLQPFWLLKLPLERQQTPGTDENHEGVLQVDQKVENTPTRSWKQPGSSEVTTRVMFGLHKLNKHGDIDLKEEREETEVLQTVD